MVGTRSRVLSDVSKKGFFYNSIHNLKGTVIGVGTGEYPFIVAPDNNPNDFIRFSENELILIYEVTPSS